MTKHFENTCSLGECGENDKMKMKKIAYFLPAICLALISMVAKADTLTFNGVPGGGEDGPYSLTLGSNSANLLLFCMNDHNYIQGNESWSVDVVNGGALTGPLATQYQQEAYIYSHYDGSNAGDIQAALWKIFDPAEAINASAQALVTAAANMSDAFYSNGSLNNFTFYLYDGGSITNQYGDYPPQNFIGTSPVPEPSSLILLGTGLVGLAGAVRRKLARA